MAGERILIVEDNPMNRKLLRDVLQVNGYQPLESGTAEDGLERARKERPDLILMDIQLPGMDGIAALHALKDDPETRAIPVIAVTASAMPMEREKILAAGFDGYQSKPLGVKQILGEVRRMLDARTPGG